MKEIVLVTLAVDSETGRIDPKGPFMVNSRRRGPRSNRPYEDEPGVIEQFRPGEPQARFEAEWNDEKKIGYSASEWTTPNQSRRARHQPIGTTRPLV